MSFFQFKNDKIFLPDFIFENQPQIYTNAGI